MINTVMDSQAHADRSTTKLFSERMLVQIIQRENRL